MVKQGAERRNYIRAKHVLTIQFRLCKSLKKETDRTWHLSTTHDMSYGGLAFYTNIEYKKGDILELNVVMSGVLDIYKGKAKVIRVEQKKRDSSFLIAVEYELTPKRSRAAKSFSAVQKTPKRSLKKV